MSSLMVIVLILKLIGVITFNWFFVIALILFIDKIRVGNMSSEYIEKTNHAEEYYD